MPIHEIKDPAPAVEPAVPRPPLPGKVRKIAPIVRIKRYEGGRDNKERRSPAGRPPAPAAGDEKSLFRLVAQVNETLDHLGVSLHLVLVTEKEGYLLEIFDCSAQQLCRVIKELEVSPAELPALLRKLQSAAGLMVDTFS